MIVSSSFLSHFAVFFLFLKNTLICSFRYHTPEEARTDTAEP